MSDSQPTEGEIKTCLLYNLAEDGATTVPAPSAPETEADPGMSNAHWWLTIETHRRQSQGYKHVSCRVKNRERLARGLRRSLDSEIKSRKAAHLA
jgi:hypothetical protein